MCYANHWRTTLLQIAKVSIASFQEKANKLLLLAGVIVPEEPGDLGARGQPNIGRPYGVPREAGGN